MGLHAQRTQAAVEALARPVAPVDRLVNTGGKQQLGWDLARPLGQPDLIPAHLGPGTAVYARGVDSVAQAVRLLQLMHHPIAARPVVGIADGLAVLVDARRHDVDVVLGVRDDDVGRVPEAHALHVVARERAPLHIGQTLTGI